MYLLTNLRGIRALDLEREHCTEAARPEVHRMAAWRKEGSPACTTWRGTAIARTAIVSTAIYLIARACEGWSLSEGCETFLTAGCSESHCARALAFSECALPRSASVSTPCGTPVQVRGGLDVGVGVDVGEWALRGSGQGASGRAWGRACECVG
eukprot:scaffold33245_cov61-Phaeocystis_antarctica.AAC.6